MAMCLSFSAWLLLYNIGLMNDNVPGRATSVRNNRANPGPPSIFISIPRQKRGKHPFPHLENSPARNRARPRTGRINPPAAETARQEMPNLHGRARVLSYHYPQVWAAFRPIPTGLRPPAQGCEPASYPGCSRPGRFNPNGVAAFRPTHGHNPVGVGRMRAGFPRVARASQPWALGRNPVGIQRILSGTCG